ncbi:PREDICTED: enhancer of rudimentary homolog isoform X5 [Theobroma cacao]|uniref:Enhancer of rudimentary homolog isoform X5 n=1 Tax=Theobroma cacao TaxID=3641 RepID=A0AB32WZZ3_THECC|nr:PREDICTED: enhancer of rudimentary homolog isoform X5 [Theobroma cacao]
MQTSQNRAPRTFVDYDSISQAMDGIRGLYERKLKKLNPATQNITYDIGVLYNFIDGLADMIALAYDSLSLPPPFSDYFFKSNLAYNFSYAGIQDGDQWVGWCV